MDENEIWAIWLWIRILTFLLVALAISVAGWVLLDLHNVVGIPLSVLFFVLVFVGLPYYLNHLNERKKSRKQQEIRELDSKIFLKILKRINKK
jgi:uncharacterized iron-regulated membrane protein